MPGPDVFDPADGTRTATALEHAAEELLQVAGRFRMPGQDSLRNADAGGWP